MSTAHREDSLDKMFLWLFPLPTEQSTLCYPSECIQEFRAVSVAIANPGEVAQLTCDSGGERRKVLTLAQLPLPLSHTQKSHIPANIEDFSLSLPQTKVDKERDLQ